ncbi:MAG: acylneuraminate cytidylyltransferase family protein [Gammaproteobacteria bacterium]|nr:acylneuraminate cytidylyltransferase family protein [Gammaproteobacteria bacterium]
MRILALVTARAGSKRLPGKNTRLLGGRPLLTWSIDAVRGIPDICDILVSTDDEAIAGIARTAGALVPWLRPAALSGDTATSVDVALHALDRYEAESGRVEGLLLLQPTSPFRSRETIIAGIAAFQKGQARPVVGFSPAQSHPLWCFLIENDRAHPFCQEGGLHLRSQTLPPAHIVNGAFYLIAPQDLRANRSFYSDDMLPLIMDDPREGLDIDTQWDWDMAEALIGMGK